MKIVQVTYTVQAAYADKNKENISAVMSAVRELNNGNLFYHVCIRPDGRSFIHTAFFKTDEDNKMLLELPAFKSFQQQLKESMPEVPPKQEFLSLVGSSADMFR